MTATRAATDGGGRWRHRSAILIAAPAMATILAALLAPRWLPGELCSHWTLHAALLTLLGALLATRGSPAQIALMLVTLIGVAPWILDAHRSRAAAVPGSAAGTVRRIPVLCVNEFDFNQRRGEARAALIAQRPAIAGLEEISREDQAALLDDRRWPYQLWTFRSDLLDVALLSAFPLRSSQVHNLDGAGVIEAVIAVDGRDIRVFVVHLYAPRDAHALALQDRQLASLAALIAASAEPVLAIGDYNLSPGTPRWRSFLAASGLRRAPGSAPASWPAALGVAGIPIDHLLARGLALDEDETFTVPGDDHRGVRATLLLGSGDAAQ